MTYDELKLYVVPPILPLKSFVDDRTIVDMNPPFFIQCGYIYYAYLNSLGGNNLISFEVARDILTSDFTTEINKEISTFNTSNANTIFKFMVDFDKIISTGKLNNLKYPLDYFIKFRSEFDIEEHTYTDVPGLQFVPSTLKIEDLDEADTVIIIDPQSPEYNKECIFIGEYNENTHSALFYVPNKGKKRIGLNILDKKNED